MCSYIESALEMFDGIVKEKTKFIDMYIYAPKHLW